MAMRVAWIQDQDPFVTEGGAQLTDRAILQEGIRRGHEIQVIVPTANPEQVGDIQDLVVFSNAVSVKKETYEDLKKRGIPYVLFPHDYGPYVCRWRLFYPMEERCQTLCYLRDRWRDIIKQSAFIFFMSPLHRDAFLFAYPSLAQHPFSYMPSALPVEKFYDLGKPRNGIITVNSLYPFKGIENIVWWAKEHPAVEITAVGTRDGIELPPNIKVVEAVPFYKMNALYNAHEALLHLPTTPQPCERTVIEAYLAGCRIIGNGLIGVLSYPWFTSREQVRSEIAAGPDIFWTLLEERFTS